jgi:hypothetical protein
MILKRRTHIYFSTKNEGRRDLLGICTKHCLESLSKKIGKYSGNKKTRSMALKMQPSLRKIIY